MTDDPTYLTLFQVVWWIAIREIRPDIRMCDRVEGVPGDVPSAEGAVKAFSQAEEELLFKLQLGQVVATGLDADDRRQVIPPHFWQDAAIDLIDSAAGVPPTRLDSEPGQPRLSPELREAFVSGWRWKGVTVPTEAVKKIWPGGQAAACTTYALASAAACEEELYNLMASGPPTDTKSEYRKEMSRKYRISVRAFDRAWANAVSRSGNTDWSKAGRKSKHQNRSGTKS